VNPAAIDSTTPVVVDTDVISFIFKDHQLAPAYQAILAGRSLTVSLVRSAEFHITRQVSDGGVQPDHRRLIARRIVYETETPVTSLRSRKYCEKPRGTVAANLRSPPLAMMQGPLERRIFPNDKKAFIQDEYPDE
jgi:hypothetical protein